MSDTPNQNLLHVDSLCVTIDQTPVLTKVTLQVNPGTLHVIMGKNGSGKSTLARTLMGDPACTATSGSITYKGHPLLELSADKRAQQGIFLAFQNPCVLPGVSVLTLLKEAYQAQHKKMSSVAEFKEYVVQQMLFLGIEPSFCDRNVNEGFSGGEKKKLELLQLLVFRPTCIILDEIDSGLDIDALKLVTKSITAVMTDNPSAVVIVVTHNPHLLEQIKPDCVHIMSGGSLTHSGDTSLLSTLKEKGFDAFTSSI